MKKTFAWYLPVTDNEISEAWEHGVLTVDANVLLDLYRYHENTRESILTALAQFSGRLWISYQAATEFIRNRSGVVISTSRDFDIALSEIDELRSSVKKSTDRVSRIRIVSEDTIVALEQSMQKSLDEVEGAIAAAKEAHPNFLQEDPIFGRILEMFDGSVGEDFAPEDVSEVRATAKKRIESETPPGYLDRGKGGDRSFGDYFLWLQVLNKAKSEAKPVILVTSERKDDWWEKHSGLTIGPRLELRKEAEEVAGQRVLLYSTERFLKYASERIGGHVDEQTVSDILEVSTRPRKPPAVWVDSQVFSTSSDTLSSGTLFVSLNRPTYNFTASGSLDPEMTDVPVITASLVKAPEGMPKHKLRYGTGTPFDFNVHLKSESYGVHLPTGEYEFSYRAQSEPTSEDTDSA